MRTKGSPELLEYRRLLAMRRLLEGYTVEEVAGFLDIDASSVRRWRAQFQEAGWEALLVQPVSGRPLRLTCTQEKIVRRWLSCPAIELGFGAELWTDPRLARVIGEEFGVVFHPDYLGVWMRQRGYNPQKPQRVAREHHAHSVQSGSDRLPASFACWTGSYRSRLKKSLLFRM